MRSQEMLVCPITGEMMKDPVRTPHVGPRIASNHLDFTSFLLTHISLSRPDSLSVCVYVCVRQGWTFERVAIEAYIRNCGLCPCTQRALRVEVPIATPPLTLPSPSRFLSLSACRGESGMPPLHLYLYLYLHKSLSTIDANLHTLHLCLYCRICGLTRRCSQSLGPGVDQAMAAGGKGEGVVHDNQRLSNCPKNHNRLVPSR